MQQKSFDCECYTHMVNVVKNEYDKEIFLNCYELMGQKTSFFQRVKLALGYIFKPEKYDIHGDLILSPENARNMGKFLLELTKKDFDTDSNTEFMTGE